MKISILLFTFLSTFFSKDHPQLTLHVENIDKLQGKIVIGVFNSEKGFLKEGIAKNYSIEVGKKKESIVIKDLPPGEYAISIYHDENSDSICNLNFLGIPKEGYGFSNNIKPKFSAPSYADCKFSLNSDQILTIKLIN